MRNLRNSFLAIVAAVLLVGLCAGKAKAAVVYNTTNFMQYISSFFTGGSVTFYTANFTLDGLPNANVYVIGTSTFPDGVTRFQCCWVRFG